MKQWLLNTAVQAINQEVKKELEYEEEDWNESYLCKKEYIDAVFLHSDCEVLLYNPHTNAVRLVAPYELTEEYGIYHELDDDAKLWADISKPCTILIELVIEIGTGKRYTEMIQ